MSMNIQIQYRLSFKIKFIYNLKMKIYTKKTKLKPCQLAISYKNNLCILYGPIVNFYSDYLYNEQNNIELKNM